jgi:tyrosyl-tRNA synthetase
MVVMVDNDDWLSELRLICCARSGLTFHHQRMLTFDSVSHGWNANTLMFLEFTI